MESYKWTKNSALLKDYPDHQIVIKTMVILSHPSPWAWASFVNAATYS